MSKIWPVSEKMSHFLVLTDILDLNHFTFASENDQMSESWGKIKCKTYPRLLITTSKLTIYLEKAIFLKKKFKKRKQKTTGGQAKMLLIATNIYWVMLKKSIENENLLKWQTIRMEPLFRPKMALFRSSKITKNNHLEWISTIYEIVKTTVKTLAPNLLSILFHWKNKK